MNSQNSRRVVGTCIMLLIVLVHVFRAGTWLNGDLRSLYYSYASDLMIPFGVYFLLCISEFGIPMLKSWYVKALLVFGVCVIAEVLQLFGVYALGITFDILDILMYALGIGTAVVFDRFIFRKLIPAWEPNQH